jgi:hypothetical protein
VDGVEHRPLLHAQEKESQRGELLRETLTRAFTQGTLQLNTKTLYVKSQNPERKKEDESG